AEAPVAPRWRSQEPAASDAMGWLRAAKQQAGSRQPTLPTTAQPRRVSTTASTTTVPIPRQRQDRAPIGRTPRARRVRSPPLHVRPASLGQAVSAPTDETTPSAAP